MSQSIPSVEGGSDWPKIHCQCFACGAGNELGLQLAFEVDQEGVATATWLPSRAFQSYPGRLHGGVIATLLDAAMVHALFAKGVGGVTAELTIRYSQSVVLEEALQVHGYVDERRHGVYLCRAGIRQAGRAVVRASAKFFALPAETTPEAD